MPKDVPTVPRTASPQARRDDREGDDVATVMEGARAQADADDRALANVKRGLFGPQAQPVMLARYVLLQRIGTGGLGIVYAAYDPQLDRRVAIKLVRAKKDGDGGRERLVREAQAMAKLAHPNVITVHDVGTYGGPQGPAAPPGVEAQGVFVVMEHVDGVRLDRWLEESQRPWPEIVDALLAAGRGLLAAHRAGLVHRDFKPSNVLVGRDGRVRVLDFGLARADASYSEISNPDDEPAIVPREAPPLDTPLTLTGGVLGTPAYMAPEQHQGRRADVRADQYAFCVTLWQALYGKRPFVGSTVHEIERHKLAYALPTDPPRSNVPRRIHAAIRRGLAPDPIDRHASLDVLLRILERRPARLRTAAAVVLIAGLGAAAWLQTRERPTADPCEGFAQMLDGSWDPTLRSDAQRAFAATGLPFAERTWATVADELDAYAARWSSLRREVCEATRVHAVQPINVMERRFSCLDRGLEGMRRVGSLFAEADASVVIRAVEVVEQLPSLPACLEPWAEAAYDDADVHVRGRLEVLLSQAQVLRAAGRYAEAESQAASAVAIARGSEHGGGLARAFLAHGVTLVDIGDDARAERALFEAIAAAERSGDEHTAATALLHAARGLVVHAKNDDAERLLEIAAAKIERHGLGPALGLELLHVEGDLLRRRGRVVEALDNARMLHAKASEQHDPLHTEVARAQTRLAVAMHEAGDSESAASMLERAHDGYAERLGADHPHVAEVLGLMANLDDDRGAYERGLARQRKVVEILGVAYGPGHVKVGHARVNLAASLMARSEREDALEELRQAAAILEANGRGDHVDMANVLINVATLERERDNYDIALTAGDRAVEILEAALGGAHPSTAIATAVRAQVLSRLGRHDDAIAGLVLARDRLRESGGDEHPLVGLMEKALAEAEVDRDRIDAATAHFQRAVEILAAARGDLRELVTARIGLARGVAARDPDRARAELHTARREWIAAGRDWDALVSDDAWIPPLMTSE